MKKSNSFEIRKITKDGFEILAECNSRAVAYLYYNQFIVQSKADERIVIFDKIIRDEIRS